MTLISAMAARVAGVGGAGLRWMAKRSLMVQPLGWSMYCSGEVMLTRQYDKDQKKIAEAVRGLPAEKTSWLVRVLQLKLLKLHDDIALHHFTLRVAGRTSAAGCISGRNAH